MTSLNKVRDVFRQLDYVGTADLVKFEEALSVASSILSQSNRDWSFVGGLVAENLSGRRQELSLNLTAKFSFGQMIKGFYDTGQIGVEKPEEFRVFNGVLCHWLKFHWVSHKQIKYVADLLARCGVIIDQEKYLGSGPINL